MAQCGRWVEINTKSPGLTITRIGSPNAFRKTTCPSTSCEDKYDNVCAFLYQSHRFVICSGHISSTGRDDDAPLSSVSVPSVDSDDDGGSCKYILALKKSLTIHHTSFQLVILNVIKTENSLLQEHSQKILQVQNIKSIYKLV